MFTSLPLRMFNFHLTVEKDFFGVNFKIFSHAIQLERVISSLDIEHFLGLLSSKNVLTKQNHTYLPRLKTWIFAADWKRDENTW